jgi:hypothetical protein
MPSSATAAMTSSPTARCVVPLVRTRGSALTLSIDKDLFPFWRASTRRRND